MKQKDLNSTKSPLPPMRKRRHLIYVLLTCRHTQFSPTASKRKETAVIHPGHFCSNACNREKTSIGKQRNVHCRYSLQLLAAASTTLVVQVETGGARKTDAATAADRLSLMQTSRGNIHLTDIGMAVLEQANQDMAVVSRR